MKRLVAGGIVLLLVTLGWGDRGLGEEAQEPRGELRVVDKSPLNWASITYNVFEHLIELDKDGKLVPRLATGWPGSTTARSKSPCAQGSPFTMARSLMRRSSSSTGTSRGG